MSTEDPDITFDDEGVCKYCQFAEAQTAARQLEKAQLPWVIYDIKKQAHGQAYDCLLGLSGGVDSSYALHLLREQGLHPLTFSVDNGWQTPEAQENIMRMVEGLKVPFYRYTIDLEKFRELQKAFVKAGVKNVEIPTDHILMATTYEMAHKHGIKTIISGGNWQTEGTMPPSYGYNARDLTHIKAIAFAFGPATDVTKGLPTISLLKYLYLRNIKRIRTVNLLDYYDYNRERAKQVLSEKYGWKDYGEKHAESTFTKWFQNYYLPTKFGLDKRRPHYSSLIHSGQMTRKEALKLLGKRPEQVNIGVWEIGRSRDHSEFRTNQAWENLWIKFFNLIKPLGWKR